jgi:SAM-dependent methyltransferase
MSAELPAEPFDRRAGVAVFVFSLGLLLYELCLTRVLSVFFYCHTAFLAVSLAMLGVGAGGVWVYLLGERIGRRGVAGWMLAAALSVTALPIAFSLLPFDIEAMNQLWHGRFIYVFLPVALACLLPFLFGGVVWASWFRTYRADAPRLYGWDLLGAALGALCLVPAMNLLGGPAALLACGGLLAAGTAVAAQRHRRRALLVATVALGLLAVTLVCVQVSRDSFAIKVEKGDVARVLFKRWNAFSRVVLLDEPRAHRGLSAARRQHWHGRLPAERAALIDINAFAPLIAFDGDLGKVRYLRQLVSNMAHHLRPPGQRVCVLGPGGGKDVLGALLFAPKHVTGIEINPILVNELVRRHQRRFTGDIYRHPKVTIHVGDARAELSRMGPRRFGVIIANSVATFAAHSSGAMNLAEQSLYTREACGLYLDRLAPGGILSVSIWDDGGHPLALRWLHTCAAAAKARGVKSLADRAAVISTRWEDDTWFSTILIADGALSGSQSRRLRELATGWGYQLLYAPGAGASHASFGKYFRDPGGFVASFGANISATSDDKPFFFYTSRFGDAAELLDEDAREDNVAVVNLLLSLVLVCALLIAVIGLPLVLHATRRKERCPLGGREIAYFLLIGFGFMLVEIPLIQRLTLFLGHPTYALTVVLAGLLLYSGAGSLFAGRWPMELALGRWRRVLLLLCALLVALRLGLDPLLAQSSGLPTAARVAVALALLAPLGFCMGLPLPLAMLALGRREPGGIPWAWAINGASSVVASVGALWLAAFWGFSAVFLLALGCYALATLSARATVS